MSLAHLPPQPTAFVGRDRERSEIAALLTDPACRLLTLVGPGGIGKTRLALQAAADQQSHFVDGVAFVALAPVASPDFLVAALATALEIPTFGSKEPLSQILNYLRDKHMLLVMDNFEHLLDGAVYLTDLLNTAPHLKILVTSRERLNLREEWIYVVDGLAYPAVPVTNSSGNYSAVELFVQQARQVQHNFSLVGNIDAVLSICRQVEGMPLGLELAAGWLRVMSCQQIAARMASNLDFLITPLRNIAERHRSLRVVFQQSWSLLSAEEQAVLMRLSLFQGGFDFEAAVEVASATLPVLASLADKSLLRADSTGRYDLHELLRQYAWDKLAEAGQTESTMQRFVSCYLKLAEAGEAHAYGGEQVLWYDKQKVEMDNLRAALAWTVSHHQAEMGLRMAGALRWVWEMRGHLVEGLGWFNKLLPMSESVSPSVHAKALHRASELAGQLAYGAQATTRAQESLDLARSTNDRWNIAWALSACAFFGDVKLDQAIRMLEESLSIFRDLKDPMGISHTLRRLAGCAIAKQDYPYAAELLEQALVGDRQEGDKNAVAWSLCFMGVALWGYSHQSQQVIPLYEEGIALFREIGDVYGTIHTSGMLADVERAQGNFERSRMLFQETLRVEHSLGIKDDLTIFALAGLAALAAAQQHYDRAAKMFSVVHTALESGAYNAHFPPLVAIYDITVADVRAKLDAEAFDAAWTAGGNLPLDQAITDALQDYPAPIEMPDVLKNHPLLEALSPREFDVLRLLYKGCSNTEIAQQLFISVATVKVHARSIYGKLNVSNRTQAIIQAQKLNLL